MRRAPNSALTVRLLRRALRRHDAPTWLVTDKDPVLHSRLPNAFLASRGTRRRYGAVGRHGSIAIIERLWRSMKQEYVGHLFLLRPLRAIEARARRWVR